MCLYSVTLGISLYTHQTNRTEQSLYHRLTLVMFLMQSVTLWPISTIFLSGVWDLDACVMIAWYPEQLDLHVIAYFKTHLRTVPKEVQSYPDLDAYIFCYLEFQITLGWTKINYTYETQPKNIVLFDKEVEILIEEQHSGAD